MRADQRRVRTLLAVLAALTLTFAACGGGSDTTGGEAGDGAGAGTIKADPRNGEVTLTIGSQSSPEEELLGEIYAQALAAAGYKVKTALDLGSDAAALQAVKTGRVSGYPEQTGTALTSFFGLDPGQIPADPAKAWKQADKGFEKEGLEAFEPTPFAGTKAIVTLKSIADQHGLKKISDIKRIPEALSIYGPPVCERIDCQRGLEEAYGVSLRFSILPFIALYGVLVNKEAQISIRYSTDPQLAAQKDKYVMLADDKHFFRGGNFVFVTGRSVAEEAGPDYEKTILEVQEGLSLRAVQELRARMEFEAESPEAAAAAYLRAGGYVG